MGNRSQGCCVRAATAEFLFPTVRSMPLAIKCSLHSNVWSCPTYVTIKPRDILEILGDTLAWCPTKLVADVTNKRHGYTVVVLNEHFVGNTKGCAAVTKRVVGYLLLVHRKTNGPKSELEMSPPPLHKPETLVTKIPFGHRFGLSSALVSQATAMLFTVRCTHRPPLCSASSPLTKSLRKLDELPLSDTRASAPIVRCCSCIPRM